MGRKIKGGRKPRSMHRSGPKRPINRKKQGMRQTARAGRPLPQPHRASQMAARQRGAMSNARSEEEEELQDSFESLLDDVEQLDSRAELGSVYDEIGRIESLLTNLPAKLDDLRDRGFVHAAGLEDRIEDLDIEWDEEIRPRVDRMLQSVVDRLNREVDQLENRIRPNPIF